MHVLFLPKTLYGADVEAALEKLRADPAVQICRVDRIRHISVMPNDPLFVPTRRRELGERAVVHEHAELDAHRLWRATDRGSVGDRRGLRLGHHHRQPGLVIADVDTGMRFDQPDLLRAGLGGRLLPGYDFVGEDHNPTTEPPRVPI